MRCAWIAIVALGVLAGGAASAASAAASNPPHGHWVAGAGGDVLVCDLTYYPVGEGCLQPLAFRRRADRADRLPSVVAGFTSRALVSRHVETARDASGNVWNLFLAIEDRSLDPSRDPCLEAVRNGSYWGGLCVPGADLVSPGAGVRWSMGDRVLFGIAGNTVAHVRILDAQRHRRPVSVTPDRAFIYFCTSDCGCEISAVVSLSNTRVATTDDLAATGEDTWCVAAQVRALLDDWHADGRIDGTYACAVVEEAMRRLRKGKPADADVTQAFAAYEQNVC